MFQELKINSPKYKLQQIETAKLHQQNANTRKQLRSQSDHVVQNDLQKLI